MVLREYPNPLGQRRGKGSIWDQLAGLQGQVQDGAIRTSIVDVVPPGSQTVAAGATLDEELTGDWRVQTLAIDIAPDVEAYVYLDDRLRFSTKDRLGMGGQLTLGDASGRSYMAVGKVRVEATNRHSRDARDVRVWMVVL